MPVTILCYSVCLWVFNMPKAVDPRKTLTQLLVAATDFSQEAAELILKCCNGAGDVSKHGPLLWSLMDTEGSPLHVTGLKFFVYIQYYFCAIVYLKNKLPIGRFLTDAELGYLTAIAAKGMTSFLCHLNVCTMSDAFFSHLFGQISRYRPTGRTYSL